MLKKSQRGQSIVEFALVLPIFLLIMLGLVEFGRLWMTVNVLTGAAREGARAAAVHGAGSSEARTAAQNVLSGGNVSGATITVVGPNASGEVRVTIGLSYSTITGSLVPGLSSTFQLSQSASMRWEG